MVKILLLIWLCLVSSSPLIGKWEQLHGCRFVPHGSNDGDSFRLKIPDGRELQFRLYFVDTPEVGLFYPDRVTAQAEYFGISQREVLRVAADASHFTKHFLEGKSITVWTEWKDAWGLQKRYAALVYCEGESLIEALVGNGLVRLRGFQPEEAWPGGWIAKDYRGYLQRLERKAKSESAGGWKRQKGGPQFSVDSVSEGTRREDKSSQDKDRTLVDLNRASREEIESLPGIGPVLTERILEARPFSTVEDLVGVNGIGDQLLRRLQPLVSLGFDPSLSKTAAFYLKDPDEWNGREIELSIRGLKLQSRDAPEGFVEMIAETAFEGQPGGSIPLFLQESKVEEALRYFERSSPELILRVRFFKYQGQWVTAYYKKTPSPRSHL